MITLFLIYTLSSVVAGRFELAQEILRGQHSLWGAHWTKMNVKRAQWIMDKWAKLDCYGKINWLFISQTVTFK